MSEPEAEPEPEPEPDFWKRYSHFISAGVTFILIPAMLLISLRFKSVKRQFVKGVHTMEKGHGSFSYQLMFIAGAIGLVMVLGDSMIPNLIAGYVFGPVQGTFLTAIACMITGSLSFYLGGRSKEDILPIVEKEETLRKLMAVEDDITDREWFELVLLSRIPPIYPYHFISEFWGITDVPFFPYLGATMLGSLPTFAIYSYLGSRLPTAEHLVSHKHWKVDKTSLAVIVVSIVVSVVIGREATQIIHNHEKIKDPPKLKYKE